MRNVTPDCSTTTNCIHAAFSGTTKPSDIGLCVECLVILTPVSIYDWPERITSGRNRFRSYLETKESRQSWYDNNSLTHDTHTRHTPQNQDTTNQPEGRCQTPKLAVIRQNAEIPSQPSEIRRRTEHWSSKSSSWREKCHTINQRGGTKIGTSSRKFKWKPLKMLITKLFTL